MKKIMSVFLMLLTFCSNFFYFSFGNDVGLDLNITNTEFGDISGNVVYDISPGREISSGINDDYIGVDNISLIDDLKGQGENIENLNYGLDTTIHNENIEYIDMFYGETKTDVDNEDLPYNAKGQLNDETTQTEKLIQTPNLIISEVFFGGNKERIEIYNAGDDNFFGDLIFEGAYNGVTARYFSGVDIVAGGIKIFGNSTASQILGDIPFLIPNKQIRIIDGEDIDIKLVFSGTEIDDFMISSTGVANNTSFHKIIGTREIFATTSTYSKNVTGEYLANPGYVFLQEIEPNEPDIPENPGFTGDILDTPNLKITEIYFDGDDNRFEITNIGESDFSGNLTLNGNLNFSISTQIPAGTSKVFANNLSMFQNENNIEIISNAISFENEEIHLNLIRSGNILDTFFVHESRVDYLQGGKTSFEKVGFGQNWTTTFIGLNLDRIYNTNRGIAANPTKYFTQGENMKDVTNDRNGAEIYTGNNYNLPIDCDDFWNDYTVSISEIYFGNTTYPQYVELKILDDISDYNQIFLSGSAILSPVYFNTRGIKKNTNLLLTNDSIWYDEGRESKYNPNFQLNDSGFLIVYGLDSYGEDILDIIYISRHSDGNSTYMGSETIQCAGVFDYVDKFSPGLTIGQSQFIQITPDPIVQYIHVGGGGGGSCQNNEQPRFNNTSSLTSEIQISAIKYYGNYQILKLKNKTNSDINLRDYYLQFLDGTTKNIHGNTLFAKSTMSFVGTYGLPTNQDFCVNLMKDGEVVDRYCRNSLTKTTAQDEENIRNQLTFREELDNEERENEEWEEQENPNNTGNSSQTSTIKIIDIDYDPAGTDGDNESVTLLLLTGTQVDLSDYKFYYTKDGKTQKAKAQIQGILSYGNRQTFKGGFAFPNSTTDKKSVTVTLISPDGNTVDTYIYNPNKITEIPAGNYKINSVVDGDTVKITYDGQEFTIRFAGIDAPESSALRCGKVECFGPEAKNYLKSLIEGKTVYFEPASMDGYDRIVGYVSLNGENINEKMIRNGYAREYSYKNQSYKYQSSFKAAQNYAQNNQLGLRGNQCNGQRLCPVEETHMKYDFVFNIENIIYDPEGNDNGNEEIWIKMIEGIPIEFGTDFYLLVNDTKKSLKKYGSISPGETKKLVGTFGFPNNKETIVSLVYDEEILDTYVYNPDIDKKLEENLSGNITTDFGEIKIMSILPNPYGADGSNEEISIFYTGGQSVLDLSGFYLKIGTTKKKLIGNLHPNEETVLKGKFSFPNKGACVEIGYGNQIFDKFCYTQPAEGQKFYISNGVLASLSTLDLSILKDSKLQNIGNKVCLVYAGQRFYCKNMPYSKLSTKKINQNKMYKSFFDSFEDYMKDNWKIMYYDSEIKNYFDLLDDIEDLISDGKSTVDIDGQRYDISQFSEMYAARYQKNPVGFIIDTLKDYTPDGLFEKYSQLKQEYEAYLFQAK